MKEGIHPKVYNAKLVCACGNVVEVLSTKGEVVNVEICSACHPFFTGQQKFTQRGGRVEKFKNKYGL